MRRALPSLLVSLVTAQIGLGQQSASRDRSLILYQESTPTPNVAAAESPSRTANDRADEIADLKGAVLQLQQRVSQLTPPSGTKSDPPRAEAAGKAESDTNLPLKASWKEGLQIESENEEFRVHVGGRLQFDAGWNAASQAVQFGAGGTGELEDGAYFRRARLRIDGTLYQHFEWVTEFEFANDIENDTSSSNQTIGSPSFSNVWFGTNDIPLVGTVRAGWMKEPIGFEHLTSSRWLNFMEKSPGSDSLGLHSPGVMLLNGTENQRLTWAAGFYHVQNDNFGFGVGDGQYAETGRVTWLPWYENEGRQLLHFGIGATHRHLADNEVDLHGRPSVRSEPGSLEPSLAETGTIVGSTQEVVDAELAAVLGPWTLQSEYYCTFIHDAIFPNDPPPQGMARGTLFYQGAYVELLYFLTGEYRAYDRKEAVFDRVVPLRNFNVWDRDHGWGAWQLGVRYGYLDLQNKGVNGGTLNDIVLGLNWFLNPNAKLQWNFALDHRDSTPSGSSGWTYIFGTRLALDF